MSDSIDPCPPRANTEELDEALTRGERAQLPPNQPKGLLGEKGINLYKADSFEPDLNAGISQENDLPVQWLGVLLGYLIFFPVGFWLLWRSDQFTRRAKLITSAVGASVIVAVVVALYSR